jgi:hypothetical protein
MTQERDQETQAIALPATPVHEDEPRMVAPMETAPGWRDAPVIDAVFCEHDVRLPQGRTIVRVLISGWGWLKLESEIGGELFRLRRFAWGPGARLLDVLVPLQAQVVIRFANPFGSDQKSLLVSPTTPLAPAPPRFAGTIGTHMPPLKRALLDGSGMRYIAGPESRVRVSVLQPIPRPLLSRALAWKPTREHAMLAHAMQSLPTELGVRQRYRREKFRPEYRGVVAPEVDMSPAQRRLREWMAEIHHGADDADSAGSKRPIEYESTP